MGRAAVARSCYRAPSLGCRLYNARIPNTFRLVFDGDLVTGVRSADGPRSWHEGAQLGFISLPLQVPTWWYKHIGIQVSLDAWGNLIIDPSFVERSWILSSKTRFASHRMSSYRRGLIFARRYDGLQQFRLWAHQRIAPSLHLREDGSTVAGAGSPGPDTTASIASALNALAGMQAQPPGQGDVSYTLASGTVGSSNSRYMQRETHTTTASVDARAQHGGTDVVEW